MNIAEKLETIAEKQKKVYDAGFTAGQAAGGNAMEEFWDNYYQQNNRTNYNYAFAGAGWTDDTF
jgi:hypothetical protein